MPKRWLILVALLLAGMPNGGSDSERSLDLFILAGQSNMQGYMGNAAFYPEDPQGRDAQVRFFYLEPVDAYGPQTGDHNGNAPQPAAVWSMGLRNAKAWLGALYRFVRNIVAWPPVPSPPGQWTRLGPQWGRFQDGHFGPEVGFARLLQQEGMSPAIFKYSKPSTSLVIDWKKPGAGGLYDHFVVTLQAAIADLVNMGYRVNIRGFIWIQGESDALHSWTAQQYPERLRDMIQHMRRYFMLGSVPVILGADEMHPMMQQQPDIRAEQELLAKTETCVSRSSMLGLEKADFTHLAPSALLEHGARLYRDYHAALPGCPGQRR